MSANLSPTVLTVSADDERRHALGRTLRGAGYAVRDAARRRRTPSARRRTTRT